MSSSDRRDIPPPGIAFIDADVPDITALLTGLSPGESACVFDPSGDGLTQIANNVATENPNDLPSISIVGHGAAGEIQLGSTTFDADDLSNDAAALAKIGAAIARVGELALYACNFGEGATGEQLIADVFSYADGVEVAAATHEVGDADGGGSWNFDGATDPNASVAATPFTAQELANYRGELATPAFTFNGVNYVADVYGSFANDDSLTQLRSVHVNAVAVVADFGIDAADNTVYDNDVAGGFTESDNNIAATISQAAGLGLGVMVRPLIDFLPPNYDTDPGGINPNNGSYSATEWRDYYNPGAAGSAGANSFFTSYQSMIVAQAKLAQANGASIFCIGAELDQITGASYETYWDNIITAVRAVFSGKLSYSADWDDADSPWQYGGSGLSAGTGNLTTQVSFWNRLDYVGIDEYAPISDLANPTVTQLVAGWEDTPTDSTAYSVTGDQSLISYYTGVAAAVGEPLLFTEIGYANSSDADYSPATPGYDEEGSPDNAVADPTLQANLYTAFYEAWAQDGGGKLAGAYLWDWEPGGSGISPFSVQGLSAQTSVTTGFASTGSITFPTAPSIETIAGPVTSGATYDLTLANFQANDALDIPGLGYIVGATAVLSGGSPLYLTVTSGAVSEVFMASDPAVEYLVTSDGSGGVDVSATGASGVYSVSQYKTAKTSLDSLDVPFAIEDTAAAVSGEFSILASDSSVNAIALTDPTSPLLTLTASEAIDDSLTLGKIVNTNYKIAVVDHAAGVLLNQTLLLADTQVVTIAVEDSAASVGSNLKSLNGFSQINSIMLTDGGTPTLTLTSTQVANDGTAIAKIANSLFEALVGAAAYYYAGGNGATGSAIEVTASHATVTVKANSHVSLTGSGDAVDIDAGSVVAVIGGADSIVFVGGSGDTLSLAGTDGNWGSVYGSDGTVYLNSAQTNVVGGSDTIYFFGAQGNAADLYGTGGDWDTVYGSNGSIALTSAQASVIGGDDKIYFAGGRGNAVSLYGASGDVDAVYGSFGSVYMTNAQGSVWGGDDTAYLTGAQASVIGGGDTVYFWAGSGNATNLYDTGGNSDTVYGCNGSVALISARVSVVGDDDTIYFWAGSGNSANLFDTGGDSDTVYGSNGAVTLTSAQVAVVGGGDTTYFSGGSGNVARLFDTGGVWDTVYGSNGSVDLTSAQTSVWGGGDTIYLSGGSGNSASLYDTDGVWDAVYGSNGTVALTGAESSVNGNGNSMYLHGTNWVSAIGGSETFIFQPAIGQDTINGFAAADSMTFGASDFANFAALSSHISQSGSNALISLDASDAVTLTNTLASSLTSSQFHFV